MFKYIFFIYMFLFNFAMGSSVYYHPFDRWTYIGVTSNSIMKHCHEKWMLRYNSDVMNLLNILKGDGAIHEFSTSSVRMLFEYEGGDLYIDMNGIVSNNLKTGSKINLKALEEYRKSLSPGTITFCDK